MPVKRAAASASGVAATVAGGADLLVAVEG